MITKTPFLLCLLLFATFLIYSPSLQNNFIWDDNHLIINNTAIREFKNVPQAFTTNLYPEVGGSNFYRPLQTVSFIIDYTVWGLNPFGYHLTNLILHMLNILLVYFAVNRIFGNRDVSFLTSLVFAVHPVNTEAVTYIAGRADPLGTFFFLAAFLMYARFRSAGRNPIPLLFSCVLFSCSMLTKEASLIFPLVLILYDSFILGQRSINLKTFGRYLPYFLIFIFYAVFRLFIKGLPLGLLPTMPVKIYALTMTKVIMVYFGILLFPLVLHMERVQIFETSIAAPHVAASIAFLLLGVILSALVYRRSKKVFFCIAFFFVTLLPMMNVLYLNALMAEHWLYLPSIGLYAAASFIIARKVDFKKPFVKQTFLSRFILIVLIVYLGFFMVRTTLRNVEWGNTIEFYRNMLRHSPLSARGHVNMGGMYIKENNLKMARKELETAADLNQLDPFCYHALGLVDYMEGKNADAMKYWKQVFDITPFYKSTIHMVNIALHSDNRRFRRLFRAVKEHPGSLMANYRLSKVYIESGLYLQALDRIERVFEIDPGYTDGLFNRAWLYSKLGMWNRAIKEYEALLPLTPDDPDLYRNLGYCYAALRQNDKAIEMWKAAYKKSRLKPAP